MSVDLTISSIFTPATPYADALLGGGTGIDYGTGVNSQWTPIANKGANTGSLSIYLSHNGVNKITEFKTHIQTYGTSTSFTYGGTDTAANDLTTLTGLGSASGSSKNNADNNSGGLWTEFDADVSAANFFDRATRPTKVLVYGSAGLGISLATAYSILFDSMIYDSGGGTQTPASAPVTGELGEAGNTVLGDRALLGQRVYFPFSFGVGGSLQWEQVFTYAFTS